MRGAGAIATLLLLAACKAGPQPPENRCAMYWDYYYNAGLGKPLAERQSAEGVDFADVRAIIAAEPAHTSRVCVKILKDAFPGDPALATAAPAAPAVAAPAAGAPKP
jgi:hypothetical protein